LNESLSALLSQLDLEQLEVNLFRGQSKDLWGPRVFGGQVIGQALVAAERSIEARVPHSLHAYFLLPGDADAPIVYQVERVRDGRTFSARRVQAIQHGRPILSMIASFQAPEEGLEHAAPMPEVPPPEDLTPISELKERWLAEAGPVPPLVAETPSSSGRWCRATRSCPRRWRRATPSGSAPSIAFRTTRVFTAACSPTPRTTSCWGPPCARTAGAGTNRR
jgi:acyl-CoA thioesterase